MRIRWLALDAVCREFSEAAACPFWIEDTTGRVVAGTRDDSVSGARSVTLGGDGPEVARLWTGGEAAAPLVELCRGACERDLDHQATVADMAEATARLWRQTNALLRMSSSTSLALEPAIMLDTVLGVVEHSTNLERGSSLVRLPTGDDHYTLFRHDGETRNVPLERILSLDMLEDDVRLVTSHPTDEEIMADCNAVLGKPAGGPRPIAIARLATENDRYGFLLTPVSSVEAITSEDLKLLGAAAQIVSVAIENSHTLLRERAAERRAVQNELLAAQARDMEEMLHVVAHDLRSPMTAIYGFMHVAMDQAHELSEDLRDRRLLELGNRAKTVGEPLQAGITSIEKLNRMVQRLLDFSRVARMEYTLEQVDLRELVRGVLGSLSYQIADRDIEVEVGQLPAIEGDRVQLEHVFGNLIDNAIKYMADRAPKAILIGSSVDATSGDRVYCVEDTGIGMTEDQANKAFLPFRRFRTDAAPGEGIGLPYVRKIIERHGGRIWCESRDGIGTRFYFTLGTPSASAH